MSDPEWDTLSGSDGDTDVLHSIDIDVHNSNVSSAYVDHLRRFDISESTIPFSRLDPELVTKILLEVPTSFEWYPMKWNLSVYRLAGVSSLFRRLVMGTPVFWSSIYLHVGSDLEWLALHLERASGALFHFVAAADPVNPIHIPLPDVPLSDFLHTAGLYRTGPVSDPRWQRVLDFMLPCLSRCWQLSLRTYAARDTNTLLRTFNNVAAPKLCELELALALPYTGRQRATSSSALFQGWHAPVLDKITLRGTLPLSVSFISSRVTTLALWLGGNSSLPSVTVQDLFDILGSMPALATLILVNIPVGDEGHHGPTLLLPSLERLSISPWTNQSTLQFCARLVLPHLQSLHLNAVMSDIGDFLRICPHHLKVISVLTIDIPADIFWLSRILEGAPALRRLDFRDAIDNIALQLDASTNLSEAYLHRIKMFDISRSTVPFVDLVSDVLSEILLGVPDSFPAHPRHYNRYIHLLSTVSRIFRSIVLGDARFWSYVYIDDGTNLDTLALHFKRAAKTPLTVYLAIRPGRYPPPFGLPDPTLDPGEQLRQETARSLFIQDMKKTIAVVVPHLGHCRDLHLMATGEVHTHILFDLLSQVDGQHITALYLEINPASLEAQRDSPLPALFGGNTAGLETLRLQDAFVVGLQVSAASLTRLAIWTESSFWLPTTKELYELLRSAVAVMSLSLANVPVEDTEDPFDADNPPIMACLTDLYFSRYDSTSEIALAGLKLPKLTTLHIVPNANEVSQFVDLCGHLFEDVTCLIIDFTETPTVTQFAAVLKAFPSLLELDCRNTLFIGLHINALIMHFSGLCPVLQRIWLDEELDDQILRGLMLRANKSHFGQDLRFVTLKGYDLAGLVTIPYESHLEHGMVKSVPSAFPQYHMFRV
ncbi:hypothetical protein C8R46DRAFT_1235778 [Mycena filopes]|nr:hypothetical protein C8R46DRAFT_1235778 [Mycena filopes]